MATTSKRLIPVELLRRSCRRRVPAKEEMQLGDCTSTTRTTFSARVKKELESDQDTRQSVGKKQKTDHKSVSLKQEQINSRSQDSQTEQECKKPLHELKPDGFLEIDPDELDLERTLMGGQSFRWKMAESYSSISNSTRQTTVIFTGIVAGNVLQLWRCDNKRVAFRRLNKTTHDVTRASVEMHEFLTDYFQLKYKLKDLYVEWSQRDEHFERCSKSYRGFRILRQDPVENVFSFICATNNNIKRISLMIDKMCQQFGDRLEVVEDLERVPVRGQQQSESEPVTIDATCDNSHAFYSFPTIERLAQGDVFDALRYKLGFGYRAKFICETAKRLMAADTTTTKSSEEGGGTPRDYLMHLRRLPYKDTCKRLQEFPGIGRKVADCICLMSMDHLESVPIDCHIYEIVCRNYMKTLRQERKTLTMAVHDLIGEYFQRLHGPLAGWATSVLFIGELKHLKQQDGDDDDAMLKVKSRTGESKKKQKKKKRVD